MRGRMRRFHHFMCALLALAWTAPLAAQQPTSSIRGRVTDNTTQQPIAGATVNAAGRSAISQADGRFVISAVPVGATTLTARMVGYAPVSQPVLVTEGEAAIVEIGLAAQAVNLSEVVVVGYGETRAGN